MRKMIAALAVLVAMPVYAVEELKFGDINYFLKQGQISFSADMNATYQKNTTSNVTKETRGFVTETTTGYAFSDKLNAFVGINYAHDLETKNQTNTSAANYWEDGFANPAFGANYRFLSQNDARYNVDFGAIAKVRVESAERGSSTGRQEEDGNFADGRDSLELNARMGRKWNEANEWQFATGLIYNRAGEVTTNQVGNNIKYEQESSIDYFARASYQYRPVNEFMVLLTAQLNGIEGMDSDISSGGTLKSDAYYDLDTRFTAKYLITDNFIGKFIYGQSRNSNINRKANGVNSDIERRREAFYGLGVDFLF